MGLGNGIEYNLLMLALKKAIPAEFKVEEGKRRVTGYASTFGNIDRVDDRVITGAYAETIEDRLPRRLIKCMRNHQVLVGKPVHLEEDSTGLLTVNEISNTGGDFGGKNTLRLLQDEALTHMSILYAPLEYDYEVIEDPAGHSREIRNLKKLELREQGYVDFPANEEAGVLDVPKGIQDLASLLGLVPKDLARTLRAERYTTGERELLQAAAERFEQVAKDLQTLLASKAGALDPEGLQRLQLAIENRRALATTTT